MRIRLALTPLQLATPAAPALPHLLRSGREGARPPAGQRWEAIRRRSLSSTRSHGTRQGACCQLAPLCWPGNRFSEAIWVSPRLSSACLPPRRWSNMEKVGCLELRPAVSALTEPCSCMRVEGGGRAGGRGLLVATQDQRTQP